MYCYILAAPRLACVKPVASVHPEPGSNSPLFILFFLFFSVFPTARLTTSDRPGICAFILFLTEGFRPLPSSCLFIASFQCSLRRPRLGGKVVTKVLPLFLTTKFFANFFFRSLFFKTRVRSEPTPSGIPLSSLTCRPFRFCGCKGTHFLPLPPNFFQTFLPLFGKALRNGLSSSSLRAKLFSTTFPFSATTSEFLYFIHIIMCL